MRLPIVNERQRGRDRTLLRIRVQVDPHVHPGDLVFERAEMARPARRAPQVAQAEDLFQRGDERGRDEARTEAEVQAVAEEGVGRDGPVGVDDFRVRVGEGVHGGAGGGDQDGLVRLDADGAALAVVDGDVLRCDAGEARDDAGVAHAFVDEAEEFLVGGRVLAVGELDDAGFVFLVARAEVEVDQEGGLLGEIAGDGCGHADAVADEISIGQTGFREGFVETVGIGSDLVGGALLQVIGKHLLVAALLSGKMCVENFP